MATRVPGALVSRTWPIKMSNGVDSISKTFQKCHSKEDQQLFALKLGDLLVCEGGEVGRSAIWQCEIEECYYQKAIHRLRPASGNVTSSFLAHFMRYASDAGLFRHLSTQTSIAHLTKEQLKRFKIPAPPTTEQRRIAEILDTVDESIRSTERLIAKLDDTVTGIQASQISAIDDKFVLPLGHAISCIEAGKSPDVPGRPAGNDEWGVLKVSAVRSWGFDETENKEHYSKPHVIEKKNSPRPASYASR